MQTSSGNRDLYWEIGIFLLGIAAACVMPLSSWLINLLLLVMLVIILVRSKILGLGVTELGLNPDFKKTVMPWIVVSTTMLCFVLILKYIYPDGLFVGFAKSRVGFITLLIPFYIFVGSFIQELVFRGYVYARIGSRFPHNVAILINICLFSIMHLPYFVKIQSILFYLSIMAGIFWAITYKKYPNLYMAWISHAVVGGSVFILLQKFQ